MDQPPIRVLVVEDEKDVRSLAIDLLEEENCEVWPCGDGMEALQLLKRETFDLILADVRMPRLTGIELLTALRQMGLDTRVIVMTAYSSEATVIDALRLGVCEYLVKPFPIKEFRERVNRVLDKIRAEKRVAGPFAYKGLILDEQAHRAWIDGEELMLTRLEFNTLAFLCRSPGRTVPREDIFQSAWKLEDAEERTPAALRSVMFRLREKLHDDPHNPVYIRNVWGVGYQLGE